MKEEIDLNKVIESLTNKLAQSELNNAYKDALIITLKEDLEETREQLLTEMDKESEKDEPK